MVSNRHALPGSPVTLFASQADANTYPYDIDFRRWLTLIWPANREPWYANALAFERLTRRPWMQGAELDIVGVALEPLRDPDEPFSASAIELVASTLGARPAARLLATDVVIAGITTRRLDCLALGRAIGPRAAPRRRL